jgi:hypothetical protein
MERTLESLVKRVATLEREVTLLNQTRRPLPPNATSLQRIAYELGMWDPDQDTLREIVDRAFRGMGITGAPIPAEELQRMMLSEGVRPEDNILSRGLIDMREE